MMAEGADVPIEEEEPTAEAIAPEQIRLRELPKYIPRTLGRYEVVGGLGQGGMATVYLGRSAGEGGFHRLVAIKALHPHLSEDQAFVAMLLDEARIAARLHHPNVVPIVDLGAQDGLHFVVMEYVEGCSMFALLAKHRDKRPPRLIVPIVLDALAGLHAAHELTDDDGHSMNLVHRDVSPQNVLVGVEGIGRITDFGVARAEARINSTRPGQATIKGKVGYLSPEQLRGGKIDRRSDVFAAGVMLWSALTGKRLFYDPTSEAASMTKTLLMDIPKPSTVGLRPPSVFDDVCMRALERDPEKRFATALEMEDALRQAATSAGLLGTRQEIAAWVAESFGSELAARREAVRAALSVARAGSSDVSGPVSSGLRMMPAVGSIFPDADNTPATPAPFGAAAPSRKWIAIAGGVTVAIGAIVIGVVLSRSSSGSSVAAPTSAVAQTHAVVAATNATPPATTPATPTTPTTPTPVATQAPPAITATTPPRPIVVSHAVRPPPANPTPTTRPETTATQRWDKDSPLPPP